MDIASCVCYAVVSLASQHIDPSGMNQYNPGVGIEANGWAIGEYRNSLDRTSVYAARMLQTGHVGVFVGGITGYPSMLGKSRIDPMIAPYLNYNIGRFGVNLALVPSPLRWNESALALQVKFAL